MSRSEGDVSIFAERLWCPLGGRTKLRHAPWPLAQEHDEVSSVGVGLEVEPFPSSQISE